MDTSAVVLEIISAANLSPTEHLLLKHFIEAAVDPELAAKFLKSKLPQVGDVEPALRAFKEDCRRLVFKVSSFDPVPRYLEELLCRRDGQSCSIRRNEVHGTAEAAYIIPPSMMRGLEQEDSLVEILEAFLTPPNVARLKDLVSDDSDQSLQNLWRLSPSIHTAFRQGHVDVRLLSQVQVERGLPVNEHDNSYINKYYLRKQYPEEPEGLFFGDGTPYDGVSQRFELSTPDATLSLPDEFLFRTHCRLAAALHLFSIEDKISKGWPRPERSLIPQWVRNVSYRLSRYIPLCIRMRFYLFLRPIGLYLYGRTLSLFVQRLPFGLVLKECIRAPQSEPNALRLVETHTGIPAPRLIDVGEYNGNTYLIMTHIPGRDLAEVAHLMSYAERDRFADDLARCVAQLRKIPNNTPYLFADTVGGPVVDHRIPDGRGGPFNTEADFNNHLVSHLACSFVDAVDGLSPPRSHASYFTHSDFHATNLMVEGGRLAGIVDWECAGYKPEYWEFTKAMYGSNWKPIQQAIFWRAFGRKYEVELEVERKLWRLTPFGV